MDQPYVQIGCVANLFSRMMHFKKAGDVEYGHTHAFDHLTLLAYGSLQVNVDGQETTFTAPHMIYIKADTHHKLVAMQDNTVAYCIHALRDGNGVTDIIDPASIPLGVSALGAANSLMGKPIVKNKAHPANLRAAEWHEIEALEDGTVFVNVFAENKA